VSLSVPILNRFTRTNTRSLGLIRKRFSAADQRGLKRIKQFILIGVESRSSAAIHLPAFSGSRR